MAKKPSKTSKEIVKKEKGPAADYKIPRIPKDIFKEIHPSTLEQARMQLLAAKASEKWIYRLSYQVLKQEKHNGGLLVIKHNSKRDK